MSSLAKHTMIFQLVGTKWIFLFTMLHLSLATPPLCESLNMTFFIELTANILKWQFSTWQYCSSAFREPWHDRSEWVFFWWLFRDTVPRSIFRHGGSKIPQILVRSILPNSGLWCGILFWLSLPLWIRHWIWREGQACLLLLPYDAKTFLICTENRWKGLWRPQNSWQPMG